MDVVIGAAFGDEGKGLMTHYLASRYGGDAIVVRFNGGAQAGHTVVTNNNQRHVFSHVGSGTFAGAATFLSRYFVCNPILFLEEIDQLHQLGLRPTICIDPCSLITTPYDMMINQIAEEYRNHLKHGSCGVGFSETIERNLFEKYSFAVGDLNDNAKIVDTLHLIRKEWMPKRLNCLGINSISPQWQEYIESDDIFYLFLDQISSFAKLITISSINLLNSSHKIIFEGAQGLMLDQDYGWFPHVTRSHTGLKNIISLLEYKQNIHLNVIYVTRSYLTRHGAGPLPHELPRLPYDNVVDNTNVTNDHQGPLRYAWFNLPLVKQFIQTDIDSAHNAIHLNPQLAVTCLDQTDEQITYIDSDEINKVSQAAFLSKLAKEMNVSKLLCNFSPTIETIKEFQK